MYATDVRQTDRRQTKASLNAPPIRGGGIITGNISIQISLEPVRQKVARQPSIQHVDTLRTNQGIDARSCVGET